MEVEVVFATSKLQKVIKCRYTNKISVRELIIQSGIIKSFTELDNLFLEDGSCFYKIGNFGKIIDPNLYEIKDGDRIEIYRPLLKTVQEKRRERALKWKKQN